MKNLEWSSNSHHILELATGLKHYNRWLMSNFDKYFGKAILEIGSGQGALSKLLPPKSTVVLSDVYPEYLEDLKKLFSHSVMSLDIEKETPAKLIGKMDTVFSSNVFEHIKDDQTALKNCYQLLKPGGRLLLFVPASPEIFGKLDEEMGHYRRYTKHGLQLKAETAGFQVEKIYYANFPGYFLWWGRGRLGSPNADNYYARVFDTLIAPLLYLEKYIHPPFGQSLVLIARKY